MNKESLKDILEAPYDQQRWRTVLRDVLGATNLRQTPSDIKNRLSGDDGTIAKTAFELGSFSTSDDRIVGLYQIELSDKPRIWQNRVGLRSLLSNVYKNDVDAAFVVFVQNDKWRLSFISEIRVLTEDGNIETKGTHPRRFTYILGEGERTTTATDRLYSLNGKKLSLDDIRGAFSVEALNNEFYKHVADHFYDLVGSTTKKGKETQYRDRLLTLPGVGKDDHRTYQEFAVRLIGRTVFCWFLREKKSDQNRSLLPETLLSSNAVQNNKNYYHSILEPVFFQTLNTPMDERIDDLPRGCEVVPFLNGGLFEPQSDDHYHFNRNSQTSNHLNTLKIPDSWFKDFFEKLEEYNFTIDENSPTEVEISVDPEMLGRIFENLLAEIDPDSGETARKATGSFYTPREIVNYMVDESLILFLKGRLTADDKEDDAVERNLRKLFSYVELDNPFDKAESKRLIKAIDECKILDPACGSGAFPIGALQRLVFLIGKLDDKNDQWKATQVEKVDELINKAHSLDDLKTRKNVVADLEKRRSEIIRDFTEKEVDFGRKLFLIESCIYGVDIQPIAAEISKLRCFLTLVVDETIDESKENRGVNPLPNLEFKFVTADTLQKLPTSRQIGLFNADAQLGELEAIRHEYINSFGEAKEAAKVHFKRIQNEIFDSQVKNYGGSQDKRAFALSIWDPFGHEKVDWFDTEWMFGVKAFDIVIGNPPYGAKFEGERKRYLFDNYPLLKGQPESYEYFLYLGISAFTHARGTLSYIVPTNFIESKRAEGLREYILKNGTISSICSFRFNVWDTNAAETLVFTYTKGGDPNSRTGVLHPRQLSELANLDTFEKFDQRDWLETIGKRFIIRSNPRILSKIARDCVQLGSIVEVSQGIIVYKTREEGAENLYISDHQRDSTWVRLLDTKSSLSKFKISWGLRYLNYGSWLWCPRDRKFFTEPKIIFVRLRNKSLQNKLIGAFDDSGFYNRDNFNNIISKDSNYRLKFILALFNSELLNYWYKSHFDNVNINPEQVRLIPIRKTPDSIQIQFEKLVDYVTHLKDMDGGEPVNEYVSNSHLAAQFEEVIDALVYELYFEAEFREASVEFVKFVERDFPSVEGLDQGEKIKTIEKAYQSLRRKDSEIRNNLKLMDIRLADLLGPIKISR
jgi:adenine-specific DNA-methyltransferase